MSLFKDPPSKLGVYRVLSARAGVRVSPICLGAASIGDKWNAAYGSMDKEASFKLLDTFFDLGGNFIDTANAYQDETSEIFLGEWMEKRGNRDQIVIATKYAAQYKAHDDKIAHKVNYVGGSSKNLHVSLHASLTKLRTTYIDIMYIHWWDFETSIEEVMDALHHLVAQGKVLYLGVSDTPAWVVSEANRYAKDHGKTPFTVYQGNWNIMERSFERDIIPMARAHGMALAPWNVLAGGKLRSDADEEARRKTGEKGRYGANWERTEDEANVSRALEKVGKEVGVESVPAVAIAYVMQKTPYVFPVLGGRKVEHLKENIRALDISLSKEQINYLESIVGFDPGFPGNLIGDGTELSPIFLGSTGKLAKHPLAEPVRGA